MAPSDTSSRYEILMYSVAPHNEVALAQSEGASWQLSLWKKLNFDQDFETYLTNSYQSPRIFVHFSYIV